VLPLLRFKSSGATATLLLLLYSYNKVAYATGRRLETIDIVLSEEGWRGGDGQFHLSIERLSGRAMGLPVRRLHASPAWAEFIRG